MTSKVSDFLTRHGMHPDAIDMAACTTAFVAQMEAGNEGRPQDLLMIPTYVRLDGAVERGRPVIVMDAGGTNFRIAAVTFGPDGKPVVDAFSKMPMPGTKGERTADEFLAAMADVLAPFEGVADTVGFCFSFPTDILPNCDGRLIYFNKEVKVKGMDGRVIGESINGALAARGLTPKRFVILNDTVATMLGAVADFPDRDFDSYIGFILGTGTNTCCIVDCARIGKLPDCNEGQMAINMETGGFSGFPRGDYDRAFDATTANAGDHVFEKMISGAYLGSVLLLTAKGAAREGLFTPAGAAAIEGLDALAMRDVDLFCLAPDGSDTLASLLPEKADRTVLYDLIDAAFERAAKTVCVNLAAILVATDKGADPARPVCVSAEGTTFYKSPLFRPKLDRWVASFVNGTLGRHLEFVKAEDATLVGSAVAALLNR